MLNHHEIYDFFNRLDGNPALWRPRLGHWHAWPMVKMQLLWRLLNAQPVAPPATRTSIISTKITSRLASLPRALARALTDTHQPSAPVLLMASPYGRSREDGTMEDRFFGPLAKDSFSFPFSVAQAPLNGADLNDLGAKTLLAEFLALGLMQTPKVRGPANDLARTLIACDLPLPSRTIHHQARLALALFEARRHLFGSYFKKRAPAVLALTYAPGRMGEVAAAREHGVHVIEVQHGMFGPASSDYSWPANAAATRGKLPLPNKIAVFGPFFRDALLAGGFWPADAIEIIGAAPIDQFQPSLEHAPGPDTPFKLLFLTQPASTTAAMAFLTRLLIHLDNTESSNIHLYLKFHHQDETETSPYHTLARAHADKVTLLAKGSDPFKAMAEADAVASYNSLGLAEACAIGTPPISIMGGMTPRGFAGSFDGEDMKKIMPHVETPDELIAAIDSVRTGDYDAGALRALGRQFFASGFSENFSTLVTRQLALAKAESTHIS